MESKSTCSRAIIKPQDEEKGTQKIGRFSQINYSYVAFTSSKSDDDDDDDISDGEKYREKNPACGFCDERIILLWQQR